MKYFSLLILITVLSITSCHKRTYCPDLSSTNDVNDYDGKSKSRIKKNGLVKKKQSKRLKK